MDDFGPSSFGKFRQKSQEGGVKRLLIEEKLPEQKLPVQQQQQQQQSGRLQRKKVSTAARSSASPFERSKFDPFSEMAKEWVFFFWTLWPTLKFGSFLTKWQHTVKLLVANNEFVLWYTYLPNCQLRQKSSTVLVPDCRHWLNFGADIEFDDEIIDHWHQTALRWLTLSYQVENTHLYFLKGRC